MPLTPRSFQAILKHPAVSALKMASVFFAMAGLSLLVLVGFPADSQQTPSRGGLFQTTHIYQDRTPNETLGQFYYMLGTQMAARGQILMAEDLLSKAVKLVPNNADAFMNYGVVLEALDRNEDALRAYERAVVLDKELSHQSLYTLGLLYDKLNQTDKGITTLLKAYAVDPQNNLIAYDLGVMYAKKDDYKNSAYYSQKSVEGADNFAEGQNNYGYALAHLGRYPEALKAINKALEIKPDSAAALDSRGFAYFGMGKYQEALADYKRALEVDPTIGEIYLHMGEAYEKLDDKTRAAGAYETYLQLTPKALNAEEINRRIAVLRKTSQARQALESSVKQIGEQIGKSTNPKETP